MVSRRSGTNRTTSRTREESPVGRVRSDHFNVRGSTSDVRSRERSPRVRGSEESSRIRETDDRRRMRWENERRNRSRSRSRNHGGERFDRRGRRSRSGGRRSRSIENRGGGFRFEPPNRQFETAEFELRRKSLSRERDRRISPLSRQWVEEESALNKFSPPGPSRLFANDYQESFDTSNMPIWKQMQANEPIEISTPNQVQSLMLNQPYMENQEFQQNSGFSKQGPAVSNMIEGSHDSHEIVDVPIIPEFNPETYKLSSADWIQLIEDTSKQRNWKKDEKLYVMTSRLAGFARQWYLTTGINYKVWGEFKGAFFKAFPSDMEYYALLEKLVARKKEEKESMSTYFHHKVALLNACEIHGRKAVSCIIGGLQNSALKMEAKSQACEDPDTLYMFLRSYTNEESTSTSPKKLMDEPPMKIEKNSRQGFPQCYNCLQMGHIRAHCPLKSKQPPKGITSPEESLKLGKKDKSKSRNNKTINNVMYGSLSRKQTFTKYFTEVGIGGATLKGYVDLSSENTTIRETDALALGLAIKKQYRIIKGFNASPISTSGLIDIALCVDRAVANLNLYVVPNHIQAIPIIVGQSFTEQPHVVVMRDDNQIRFYQRMDNGKTNFDF